MEKLSYIVLLLFNFCIRSLGFGDCFDFFSTFVFTVDGVLIEPEDWLKILCGEGFAYFVSHWIFRERMVHTPALIAKDMTDSFDLLRITNIKLLHWLCTRMGKVRSNKDHHRIYLG